jgi:imidazoleglycerol phosphate dehydratase HisB
MKHMKHIPLDLTEMEEWMGKTYVDYSSRPTLDGQMRISINFLGDFKVECGQDVIYSGKNFILATKNFDGRI